MSDSYVEIKNWLILNYEGVTRIVSDILNDLSKKVKANPSNNAENIPFMPIAPELYKGWKDCPR